MTRLRVSVVSLDPGLRLLAAKAFDRAPTNWSVSLGDRPAPDADVVVYGPDAEGPGGVSFDPADPRSVIDAVAEAAARTTNAVIVTSACGGSGVTTLTLHLAAEMGRRSRVCVIDLGGPDNGALRLGLEAGTYPVWEPGMPAEKAAFPAPGGFRMVVADPARADLTELLALCRTDFRRVIVDAPALTSEIEGSAVVVVPPTRPAVERTRAFLADVPVRSAVVLNRTGPGSDLTRRTLQSDLGRRIALELPCSAALRDAEDEGRLVSAPWSRWRLRLLRLVRALEAT